MPGRARLEPGPGRGPDVITGDPAAIFALGDRAFAFASDFASHALQGSAMPRWALPVGFWPTRKLPHYPQHKLLLPFGQTLSLPEHGARRLVRESRKGLLASSARPAGDSFIEPGFEREAHGLSDGRELLVAGVRLRPCVGWSRKTGWLRRLSPRRAAGRATEFHPAGDGRPAGARTSVLRAKLHPRVARVCCIQDTKLLAFGICDAADGSRVVRISPRNRLKRGSSNAPGADSGGIPGPELAE